MGTDADVPVGQTLPLLEPTTKVESTLQVESSTTVQPPSWLHTNLRSLLMVGIVGMVCWMAWQGDVQARSGLIAAFGVLIGMLFGERAALKQRGVDS